ncbi:MAG: class I SAM-dependent methyltransferase [Paracoccaceae bacterium]
MNNQKNKSVDTKRKKPTLEMARNDPASLYDKAYYTTGCSIDDTDSYGRHEPWLSFFGNAAAEITKAYQPKTVVDIGCAFGLLVEALCDRGVDAVGYDLSPYAISNARADMVERLKVHSITDPIPLPNGKKYDLAICIEVLEHLPPEQAEIAIGNLCDASDRVIFSSSPDDFDEPTHFNVQPTEKWLELFKHNSFFPAKNSSANYIAEQTFVVEKGRPKTGILHRLFGR